MTKGAKISLNDMKKKNERKTRSKSREIGENKIVQ